MRMTSFTIGLSMAALAAVGCGDDGADGAGGSGGGGTGGGDAVAYVGQATVILMNPGPERVTLDVRDAEGAVQTADLGVGERALFPAGLVEGTNLDDEPCLYPDVRTAGESEPLSMLACSTDGDVVALAGGVSTALSQLRPAPAEGVQIAHLTRLDEQGMFFFFDPEDDTVAQAWEITELDTVVPANGALEHIPSVGSDPVVYAEAGWLGDAGFTDGARLVTMATTAGSSPALSFVACRLADTLDCVEVAAPQ